MFGARTKGQTTLEVVILIGFVVAALIAMGVYIKRGIQGRLRSSTDQIGEQYSAQHTTSTYTTSVNLEQDEVTSTGGVVETEIKTNEQKRTGEETVSSLADED